MTVQTLPNPFGRYHIDRELGKGGMGAVYLARDTVLKRRVALKVPHFDRSTNPEVIQRFYREAEVAARIEHPNVCSVHDVGEIAGIHYLSPVTQHPPMPPRHLGFRVVLHPAGR